MTILLSHLPSAPTAPALTDTAVGVGGGVTAYQYTFAQVAQTIGAATTVVTNIAALRNYGSSSLASGSLVYMLGHSTPGDGGQGFFVWNPGSTVSDDNGTIINPTWNTGGGSGPNLVTNGTFAAGSTGWTVTSGTPIFTTGTPGNVGRPDTAFWQAQQVISGLSVGFSYVVSYSYTLASGSSQLVFASLIGSSGGGAVTTPQASLTPVTFNVTAGSTSQTLQIAGDNAANSMTNFSVAQAPGGRWLRQIDEPGVAYPEWWGVTGTNDDIPSQAAINWAQQFLNSARSYGARGKVKWAPGKTYFCNSQLGFYPGLCILDGQGGAILDFSGASDASNPCILVKMGTTPVAGNAIAPEIYGMQIVGNDGGVQDGIGFDGAGDNAKHLSIEHVNITNCNNGLNWTGANTYVMQIRNSAFTNCVTAIWQSSGSNSGENMIVDTVNIQGCDRAIYYNNSNAEIFIYGCSIDYNATMILAKCDAARIRDCHFETNFFTPSAAVPPALAPFEVYGGGSNLFVKDCEMVWTATSPPPWVYTEGTSRFIDNFWSFGFGAGSLANMTVVPSGITLDFISSDLTPSNNNLTITLNTVDHGGGTRSPSSYWGPGTAKGKWFFSATIGQVGTTQSGLGIGQYTGDNAVNSIGSTNTSIGFFAGSGAGGSGGGFYGNLGAIRLLTLTVPNTTGTVWWIAVDFTNALIWGSADGGATWNGSGSFSPGAGTGGLNIASLIANLSLSFPAVFRPAAVLNTTVGDNLTINFNPTPATGLTGFSPWTNVFTLGTNGVCYVEGSVSSFPSAPFAGIDAGNTLNSDPTFENSTAGTSTTSVFLDAWYIDKDTATITSRTTGTNLSILIGATKPFSGAQELNAVKSGAAATAASFAIMLRAEPINLYSLLFEYAASANSLGTVAINMYWAELLYFGSGGVPVFGQVSFAAGTGVTPTTTYQSWGLAKSNVPTPQWATHIILEFDMLSMAAGTFYLDNVQIYQF